LVNLNYTWEMSTWLSFFYQFTPLYGHNQILIIMVKNLRTNHGKYRFVRKMRFAYGQISKNWLFVRKFERNLGVLPQK